jgi:hypothetical protein
MGTKLPSGMFNTGYTQPYGSGSAANMYGGGYGGGTYDPMLGFGQSSGMGTTYDYPTRYSADYTRYAQSGQPFNQPVMGYNTYGQIFAQPQRPPPSFGKGGGGFRPPQPPAMGGKGRVSDPGISNDRPRLPQRRSNQLGLNQPPKDTGVPGSFLDFYSRQNNPANSIFEPQYGGPGATPPPLTGGVPTDSIGGFGPGQLMSDSWSRRRLNPDDFQPLVQPEPTTPRANLGGTSPGSFFDQMQQRQRLQEFESGLSGRYREPLPIEPAPVQANRQVIDENTYNSPFGQLIGVGLGGMPKQTINPYQGSYQISEIPYQGPDLTPVRQQQQLFAQQQQRSDRAPPGMMRNPNYSPTSSMLDNVALPGSADALSRQAFIPATGGFGRMAFQEGGQVPPDANMEMMVAETEQPEMAGEYDRLIQMTMQAILGQVESPDEVIQMFIDEFGVDAFRQLRDAVLKQQVPNAQTEGMVDGNGGGMDDQVMGMIGNQRPVAVSPGEYIVPADVVSGLGDGSSKSGADILDELNQAVRMARTGTTQQPRPLMETMQ